MSSYMVLTSNFGDPPSAKSAPSPWKPAGRIFVVQLAPHEQPLTINRHPCVSAESCLVPMVRRESTTQKIPRSSGSKIYHRNARFNGGVCIYWYYVPSSIHDTSTILSFESPSKTFFLQMTISESVWLKQWNIWCNELNSMESRKEYDEYRDQLTLSTAIERRGRRSPSDDTQNRRFD